MRCIIIIMKYPLKNVNDFSVSNVIEYESFPTGSKHKPLGRCFPAGYSSFHRLREGRASDTLACAGAC
jgi:hypothetical protein